MSEPLFSVIIPAYNQAQFLGDAIQSVLDQTYQNFEIIVVNDASSDDTDTFIQRFNDPRLKYIVHKENLRLSAARNTGIRAANGELIALLDADDFFHPEKLRLHVDFLREHPDIGASYNARFNLNHSSKTIREIWRPPLTVSLVDFILGFPFVPSDLVIRRDWAFKVNLFDPAVGTAEDTDFPCRLALAGCKFAGVNRALNYRRYHSGRGRRNLAGRLMDVTRVQEAVFSDPHCTEDALAVRCVAIKHHLMVIVSLALMQDETELAQKYIRDLIELDSSVLAGTPSALMEFLLNESIADENQNHETILKKMLAQLPRELSWLEGQYEWGVAYGFLLKGMRAILWGRLDAGREYFIRAKEADCTVEKKFLLRTVDQLLSHEIEFGHRATEEVMHRLLPYIDSLGGATKVRELQGLYFFNRSMASYRSGKPGDVLRGVSRLAGVAPGLLGNRGVLSIFFRSLLMWPIKNIGGKIENRHSH